MTATNSGYKSPLQQGQAESQSVVVNPGDGDMVLIGGRLPRLGDLCPFGDFDDDDDDDDEEEDLEDDNFDDFEPFRVRRRLMDRDGS